MFYFTLIVLEVQLRGPKGAVVEGRLLGRLGGFGEKEALAGLPVASATDVAPPGFDPAVVAVFLGLASYGNQLLVANGDDSGGIVDGVVRGICDIGHLVVDGN